METYKNIKYEVIFKKNKRIYIKIKNTNVLIIFPNIYKKRNDLNKIIIDLLNEKEKWIINSIKLQKEKSAKNRINKLTYLNPEKVILFGKEYLIIPNILNKEELKEIKEKIILSEEFSYIQIYGESAEKIRKIFIKWLEKCFLEYIKEKINIHSKRMNLEYSEIKIVKVKTYWGSCNNKTKKIKFNLSLIEKDKAFIEYVIIHELCHLVYPNHQKDFKKMLEKYCPNWKEIKKIC